ncbi:MAG: glycosyltransferase family 2 protein [Longimicrobiales bacterium]
MNAPEVFAVILNHNRWRQASRCAEALRRVTDVTLDFVIIDNASADDSARRLAERVGASRVIARTDNTGYAGGMNTGLTHWLASCRAPFALVLTEDMEPAPGALAELVRVARADSRAGIVGPVVRYRGQPERILSAGGSVNTGAARVEQLTMPDGLEPYAVDWIDGCCMLLRRELVEQIGGFDERYFIYYEENDLCQRARTAGWRVLVAPAASASHERPPVQSANYFYLMARNRFLFWRKNYDRSSARVFAGLMAETGRMAAWAGAGLLRPREWGDVPRRMTSLQRQVRGVALGTRDHLRGRYGRPHGQLTATTARQPRDADYSPR